MTYCKFCGSTEHIAGIDCPLVKKKHGSVDVASGSGPWTWHIVPPYHEWHSTIAARTADAKMLGTIAHGWNPVFVATPSDDTTKRPTR
jgi:hypothetical protein